MLLRRCRRSAVVAAAVACLTSGAAVPALASPGACEPAVAMNTDDSVKIVSNPCGVEVRGVFFTVDSQLVPSGPLGAPPKRQVWHCGGVATGVAEESTLHRSIGWITTRAIGWQSRAADGSWRLRAYRDLIPDPGVDSGPWTRDECAGNGTRGQAETWPPPFPPS